MDVGSRLWKVLDVRPAAEERAGVGYTAGGLYCAAKLRIRPANRPGRWAETSLSSFGQGLE